MMLFNLLDEDINIIKKDTEFCLEANTEKLTRSYVVTTL